jgi:hypothetical protein
LTGGSGPVSESINPTTTFQQLRQRGTAWASSSMPTRVHAARDGGVVRVPFHMQATMFGQAPELDEVRRLDPELAQHIAAATARMGRRREARGGSVGRLVHVLP